jgi:hypothetical protein
VELGGQAIIRVGAAPVARTKEVFGSGICNFPDEQNFPLSGFAGKMPGKANRSHACISCLPRRNQQIFCFEVCFLKKSKAYKSYDRNRHL